MNLKRFPLVIKKLVTFIIVFFLFFTFNSADLVNGVFIEGGATPLFITGFGGLSLPFSTGSFTINPSLAASLFQDEGALLFGGFNNFLYISSYFNFITDYGNLSIFGSYMGNLNNNSFLFIKTSFSKMINENFYAGFGLNIFTNNFSNFGFGLDLGITSISNGEVPIGFSFSRFSYAFVIKNLGLPIKIVMSNTQVSTPPIGIGAGASFTFLNISDIIFAKTYSDLFLYFYPVGFGLKIGLIFNIFDYIDIVTAVNIGTQQTSLMESAWFYLGLSLKIPIKDNSIFASYAYTPTNTGGQHSITTSFAFGKIDSQPPKAELQIISSSPRNAFSPNYDGQKDEINIEPKFLDNGIIAGWRIEIFNQNQEKVKEFIGQDVRKIQYVTIQKIFSRLFEKKKTVEIPKFIIWDGSDSEGNVVADGIYKIVATVWDERYNTTTTSPKFITVDTSIDNFNIELTSNIFSPNKDGRLDELGINTIFENFEEYGQIEINILDSSGNLVNSFSFNKDSVKNNKLDFQWNGNNKTGRVANEGIYTIVIKYYDDAGNLKEKKSENFKLVVGYEIINLKLLNEFSYFSNNKASRQNQLDFGIEISSTEGIKNLTFIVVDNNGNVIFSKTYSERIPNNFSWNGTKNDGTIAEDGEYKIYATAQYISGNEPKSNEIKVYKDSKVPIAEIKEQYPAFSPNNDGVQETISFEIKPEDKSKVIELNIISENGKQYSFPVNSIKSGIFTWDGNDFEGNEIEQGKYYIEIKVQDLAGNISKIQSNIISLVRKAEEVSIISDITYYSPNNDKRNDIINFKCYAENNENVIGMDLIIENVDGKIILNKNFTKYLEAIQFSDLLPEGRVFYYIKVYYNNGNSPISQKRILVVDLTTPNILLESINQYFTTRESVENSAKIKYEISEKTSNIIYAIFDKSNKKILEQNLLSESGKIEWAGKDLNNNSYPEGEYKVILTCYDLAGNKSESTVPIYLIINTVKPNLESQYKTISPNNDNLFDQTEIKIIGDLSKTIDKLLSKTIIIRNDDGNLIDTIKLNSDATSFMFTGFSGGKRLPDGVYNISLIIEYASGIKDRSEINISVDNSPPKIDLIIKPDLFSPDNDGEKDTLYITYSINDFSDIESYTIRIYRLFEDGKKSVKPFKTFQFSKPHGKTIANQIHWDGTGDEPNSLVDSAADYQLTITAYDIAGNEIIVGETFTIDILVIKTELGYKIIINSIEFDFNSAVLKRSNFKILDLLIKKILKFPDYKILIVGFTDSTGDPNYNLRLSEQRAKAVYDYLVKNDIPRSRLEYKGMGAANPIDTNDTEEGRRRNRRVEFYLIKINQ